ncbi:MAG: DNA-3-methyladenine glycosylase I [Terasakiella sp.]|nr:DNA-3-methyladenine glycosylase I [Terasakiella sp.]
MRNFTVEIPIVNHPLGIADVAVTPPESDAISKDMRRRGFKFFGSTICYAFLQATGYVDDHIDGCPCKSRPSR